MIVAVRALIGVHLRRGPQLGRQLLGQDEDSHPEDDPPERFAEYVLANAASEFAAEQAAGDGSSRDGGCQTPVDVDVGEISGEPGARQVAGAGRKPAQRDRFGTGHVPGGVLDRFPDVDDDGAAWRTANVARSTLRMVYSLRTYTPRGIWIRP
jgi:hypothetical protein